jgi:hypothetical protein
MNRTSSPVEQGGNRIELNVNKKVQAMNVGVLLILSILVLVGYIVTNLDGRQDSDAQWTGIPPDTVWQLDHMLIEGEKLYPARGKPRIQVLSGTTLAGHDGCNAFCITRESAENASQERVTVSSTLMDCDLVRISVSRDKDGQVVEEIQELDVPEESFIDDLTEIDQYEMHQDELALYVPGTSPKIMVFRPTTESLDLAHAPCQSHYR